MVSLTSLSKKIHHAARIVENPDTVSLKLHGGSLDLYFELKELWLQNFEIATILDIGANTGHFSLTMQKAFPNAHIYAFEPLPDCYQQLVKRMHNATAFTSFNLALGNQSEKLTFFRSERSSASSLLPMTDIHKHAFPQTAKTNTIEVKVEQLDVIANQLQIEFPLFVKIDVQGFEKQVLLGGKTLISQAKVILIETSFEPLYEGQALFGEIYQLLTSWGFHYSGNLYQHRDPSNGRILQSDSVFIK